LRILGATKTAIGSADEDGAAKTSQVTDERFA